MKIAFIGGTRFVGRAGVRLALAAGHEVAVAHSGTHEGEDSTAIEHLHGTRADLLDSDGPVQRWRPDVLVDTFAGGATGAKADELVQCARRSPARQIIAISSCDVYQHMVDVGLGDGTGKKLLTPQPLPVDEEAPLRDAPYPGSKPPGHDNVAMERRLRAFDVGSVTVLRPGAIYGRFDPIAREWGLVSLIKRGEKKLRLPGGGHQLFHRVAVDRVGHAIVAAAERAPTGFWACNVVDPYAWTFAGLAAEIGRILDWEWQPEVVPLERDPASRPFWLWGPALLSDRRLREVLLVEEPDPRAALRDQVMWLWDHGPPPGSHYWSEEYHQTQGARSAGCIDLPKVV